MSFWQNINQLNVNKKANLNSPGFDDVSYTVLSQKEDISAIKKLTQFEKSQLNLEIESDLSDETYFEDQKEMSSQGNFDIKQEFNISTKGLSYSARKIKNIRIVITIISLLIIGTLVSVGIVFLIGHDNTDSSNSNAIRKLNLNDILTGRFAAKKQNTTWSSCEELLYVDKNEAIIFNIKNRTKKAIIEVNNGLEILNISPDGNYLLYYEESFKIFRHSFTAKYYALDLKTKNRIPINISDIHERLVLVKWGPVNSDLVINFRGNLFYKKTPFDKEIILTVDANPQILNGIPDWVYEEEVLSKNEAVWFNPKGTKLAFIKFDDVLTTVMNIELYGEYGDARFQYPKIKPVFYPKSGSVNPTISLHIINLLQLNQNDSISVETVPKPKIFENEEYIITVVEWLDDETLFFILMNRIQNEAYFYTFKNNQLNEIYKLISKTGWVDQFSSPLKDSNGSQIALILPQIQNEKDGEFRHLSLLSTSEVSLQSFPLTRGKFVVQSLLKWDHETNLIFFMANAENKTECLHLFAIEALKNNKSKPQCLTCDLIDFAGIKQTYFSIDFSQCGSNIMITSLGPNIPSVHTYKWSYINGIIHLTKINDWETNSNLREIIEHIDMPKSQTLSFNISNEFTAKVLLRVPSNLEKGKKYPMLVEVYGGPDSSAVTDRWGVDWGSYLTSNRSIIYARIDGRGSGLQGDKILHTVYKKLGSFEVFDQINVTRMLTNKFDYIDSNKVGIWGWSYGGYVSGRALALDERNILKCATSVAPVTDWYYYDSIYTERYMQTPDANPDGFKNSSLISIANKLKNKNYLLVHGTFDDNVHFQQSLMLIKALERENILFKQIAYPDEDHGLIGVRPHLYNSLDRFFGSCFELETTKYFK